MVHLFQLRKFKTEFFTNVKFLKELAIQTRKSSKIKKYLLLATRLLLLTFLIIAFAQPFFKAKDASKKSNELYIVLDNSNSMQAKGKQGELLKRAVQELLEHTPEKINFSLITCSDNFWNTDIQTIQKELQNLEYSSDSFQVEALLAKIRAHKSAYNKDIVIISDGLQLPLKSLKSKEDESVFYIPLAAEKSQNVSIDSVYIHQTLDHFYELSVQLKAYGGKRAQLPIALHDQSKLIAKTIIDFDNADKTVNFTIPKKDFHGYVSIIDNSLGFDNNYFFTLSNPQKSNVLSIGAAGKSGFLERIFTENEFEYTQSELSALDYNLIEKQDAIVINELEEIPQSLITNLKAFVEKGGNLLLIPSSEAKLTSWNGLLSSFGDIQYQPSNGVEKKVTQINYSHPLFGGVFEKKVTNFQYPSTKKSWKVANNYPSVLDYDDQTPFLISIPKGIANVYVFAAALNTENSNFQNAPLIVPVFYNMVQNVQKVGVQSQIINDSNPFIITSHIGKDDIVSIKNEKESFIPTQQRLSSKIKLTFDENPKKAGNFSVYSKDKKIENISFNYNRVESNSTNPNFDCFQDFEELDSISDFFLSLDSNKLDTQIWKWFVIFALVCIVLEILIQKFIK